MLFGFQMGAPLLGQLRFIIVFDWLGRLAWALQSRFILLATILMAFIGDKYINFRRTGNGHRVMLIGLTGVVQERLVHDKRLFLTVTASVQVEKVKISS